MATATAKNTKETSAAAKPRAATGITADKNTADKRVATKTSTEKRAEETKSLTTTDPKKVQLGGFLR